MTTTPLIEFRDVRKRFGAQVVLDGLNLAIAEGEIVAVIGKSGVGKSVLLKHLAGLLQPDSGEILYKGRALQKLSRAERKEFRGNFSYMFQSMALFDSMTNFENVALPLEERTRLSREAIHAQVMAKLESLELTGVAEKYPSQISGGMKKRVALARALITNPEIILFDEPTTGLDPIRRNAVHAMIARYQREFGFTAILVSHDIPSVFEVAQRVAMLDGGKIVFDGTAEAIQQSADPRVARFLAGDPDLELADPVAGTG